MREIAAICPTIEPCKVQEEKFYLVGLDFISSSLFFIKFKSKIILLLIFCHLIFQDK